MKAQFSLALGLALALCSATAVAQDTSKSGKPLTAQQQRMVDCNKQATAANKTGDDRKTFMSSCLKGETAAPAATAKTTQQEKMKTCNADAKAKSLTGDARKTFMSTCLKGDAATAAAPAAAPAAAAPATAATAATTKTTQQEKMKTCSADAKTKGLKGDDRKTYMKTCLSADSAAH